MVDRWFTAAMGRSDTGDGDAVCSQIAMKNPVFLKYFMFSVTVVDSAGFRQLSGARARKNIRIVSYRIISYQ